MKILLLGKNGQVGWELQRSLAPLGELVALDRQQANLEDLSQLQQVIQYHKPSIIVNAAAYTAVDKAEAESQKATAINAVATGFLARQAKSLNAWLVHYSTDYVFDGCGNRPYNESDTAAPLNVYGATKLQGENAICDSGCQHLIFRTSWVYASRGNNFAKTMLRLAMQRDHLSVVNDQIGAPTGADLIADITAHAIRIAQAQPRVSGLYHLVASGETSWHNYARFVLAQALNSGLLLRVLPDAIEPIATSHYPAPAKRPLNSRLATSKLQDTFGLVLPDWQKVLAPTLTEIFKNIEKMA